MLQDKDVPDYVTILRVHGPFLFGVTERLMEQTADLSAFAPIVMLRLRHMTAIDAPAFTRSNSSTIAARNPAVRCSCAARGASPL